MPSIHLFTDTPSTLSLQVNLVLSRTTHLPPGPCVPLHQREREHKGESQESKKKKKEEEEEVKGVGVFNSGCGLER
jgi:hypothetical protein